MNVPLHIEFNTACKTGNIEKVKILINECSSKLSMNSGLYNSCKGGHINIVKLIIDNGANNFNDGLIWACLCGHIDIIKLMIDKGADNYDNGLIRACKGENHKTNKEIAKLLIIKGANPDNCKSRLKFEDIYYLLQNGVSSDKLKKYSNNVLKCQRWKQEFQNTMNEFVVKDVANIIVSY